MKKDIKTNEFVAIVVREELDKGEAVKIGDYYVAEMHMSGQPDKWFLFDANFNAVLIGGSAFWFGDRQNAINQAVDFVKGDTREALKKDYDIS